MRRGCRLREATRVRLLAAPVVLAAACSSLGEGLGPADGPADDPIARSGEPLQTDRLLYDARLVEGEGNFERYGFDVVVRFTNSTDQPLYLQRCYPDSRTPIYGVSPADAGAGVESAYDAVWACVGHDRQFVVGPGAARLDTLHILGPNSWDGRTHESRGALEGRFRLTYDIQVCGGASYCPAPRSASMSNAFDVRIR